MTPARTPGDVWRNAARQMSHLGWVGVVAVVAALLVIGFGAWSFIQAAFVKPPDLSSVIADQKERVAKFQDSFARHMKQIEGRQMFFPPPPPPEPEEGAEEEPTVADGPPPPPSRYGGPNIIAMIGKSVWFDDGRMLEVGDEDGGLEVIELRGPWSAILKWRGVEFDVPLFERTTEQFIVKPDHQTDDRG